MSGFRVFQSIVSLLLLAGSVWFVQAISNSAGSGIDAASPFTVQSALADNADNSGDNGSSDNDGGDNNGGDNNSDNENGNDNNGGDNASDNDSDDNGNGNDNEIGFALPPLPTATPTPPPAPTCAPAGQETVFPAFDNKVVVRVFPANPSPFKIEIFRVIDFLSAPFPPGQMVGLLIYEIRAATCEGAPLDTLPSEVNMTIHYTDVEALGLDENLFTVARLDLQSRTWVPVAKQAIDPAGNAVGTTISQPGFFVVYEKR
ncbi:MAG: hypothetical protein IT305_15050 [Chloroflexi bacterium]|nr:hypothetical protein [Chloroflexota bacterium]